MVIFDAFYCCVADLHMFSVVINTTETFLYRLLWVHRSVFTPDPSHNVPACMSPDPSHNVQAFVTPDHSHNVPPRVTIPAAIEEARKVLIMEGVVRRSSTDLQDVHFIQWGVTGSEGLLFPDLSSRYRECLCLCCRHLCLPPGSISLGESCHMKLSRYAFLINCQQDKPCSLN